MRHWSEEHFLRNKPLYSLLCKAWSGALVEQRAKQLEEAKENILAAQAEQKEAYGKKHAKPGHLQKGQLVLKTDFTRKKQRAASLMSGILGPCTIFPTSPGLDRENKEGKQGVP